MVGVPVGGAAGHLGVAAPGGGEITEKLQMLLNGQAEPLPPVCSMSWSVTIVATRAFRSCSKIRWTRSWGLSKPCRGGSQARVVVVLLQGSSGPRQSGRSGRRSRPGRRRPELELSESYFCISTQQQPATFTRRSFLHRESLAPGASAAVVQSSGAVFRTHSPRAE